MKTRLSVNINKVALLRNSRLGNYPDLFQFAKDCEHFGAQGITIHPRPDQRHIRYSDVPILKALVTTELNIEGNPTPDFVNLVLDTLPAQCTLVPDAENVLTSDSGWDTIRNKSLLRDTVDRLHNAGIRVSLFVDPIPEMVNGAKETGADCVEFYTGDYAKLFSIDREKAVAPHIEAALIANDVELMINAGHDLNLKNLAYYKSAIPNLAEVSIGHAIVADALYYGIENVIQMYLHQLKT
ncbi:MAG: pyridoxine 5'-phosphate synthase [Saprospiraceae bacterium]|nr:pyridoxine 5'-phosphate synthase [Saprospiraceae bacterium]